MVPSATDAAPDRKGLGVGEGWEDLATGKPKADTGPLKDPDGHCEGAVPDLALEVARRLALRRGVSILALPSGNVSLSGDSGIVSRNGVDKPLAVGGPQAVLLTPLCKVSIHDYV